jgi:hypothetical protein
MGFHEVSQKRLTGVPQINTGKREKSVKICADLCPIKRSADFADFTD